MGTYLDTILAAHRDAAGRDERSFEELLVQTDGLPATRPFIDALRTGDGLGVIAEIKRRSPSKGDLNVELVPGVVAAEYELGGAACLSVLTDAEFFGGAPADLAAARGACALPVLRKDFTVDRRDVVDARLMGADAVLLIVAALDDDELRSLHELATSLGLAALVEVHDERELDRAVDAGASIIGVNQRDLTTFEIDRELAAKLAPRMPDGVVRVAESGIRDVADATAVAAAGYDAVLVGESIVTSGDHAGAVAALAGCSRRGEATAPHGSAG